MSTYYVLQHPEKDDSYVSSISWSTRKPKYTTHLHSANIIEDFEEASETAQTYNLRVLPIQLIPQEPSNNISATSPCEARETWLRLIQRHNEIVHKLEVLNPQVPETKVIAGMELWYAVALEGSEITQGAREAGIDCVVDMQRGFITVRE